MFKKKYLIIFLSFQTILILNFLLDSKSFLEELPALINTLNIKIIALYFPQFHEVEENNQFWGKGFTEWTLMNKYVGEIKKPHADVGQYTMLDYHVRKKQAIMAKDHGISAFCYYHYWFKDKKVMYKGIEKILEDNEPNIPFAFCWANEPWTRNWDGSETQVLLAQEYGTVEDWEKHYRYLLQFFNHPNYIKEDDCPVLYIYRLEHIIKNNALDMLKYWKEAAKKDGFGGLKIIGILGNFQKNIATIPDNLVEGYAEHQPTYNGGKAQNILIASNPKQRILDASKIYDSIISNNKIHTNYTRGIFFGWDNSSRRINKISFKFVNNSYSAFENLILKTIENIAKEPNSKNNYILLNSWNEWTEQAMVEPNHVDGYEILNVIKKIFGKQ